MKSMYIKSHDNQKVYLHNWEDVQNPIVVVQIFHGMAEHAARYDRFAIFLNSKGYIVYADDHRGHGKIAESVEKLGYLGENGFDNIVKDEHFITDKIKAEHPNLPIFIFAHSFGSFVGQEYLNRYSNEINGLILSGSAMQDRIDAKFGLALTKLINKFGDESKQNPLLESLIFGSYCKKEKDNNSKFAWLSSDKDEVKKYDEDEYCGTVFTTNFYRNMFTGFQGLYLKEKADTIRKDIPVLVLAGEMDPVGNYGKSVKSLFEYYKSLNMSNVELKLYPEGRHELLNEVNRDEVFDYIYSWINKGCIFK